MKRSRYSSFMLAAAGLCTLALGALVTSDGNVAQGASVPISSFPVVNLSGASVVPGPGDPDGAGILDIKVLTDGVNAQVCWSLTHLTGIELQTGGALYEGVAGVNGAVAVVIGTAGDGCEMITPLLADALIANPENYYVRIDTAGYPEGALRGQLSYDSRLVFFRALATPLRAYDSRVDGTKMGSNETRNISLMFGKDGAGVSQLAVPAGSYAAEVVITVTQTSPQGYLATHAAGAPVPATSTINWSQLNSNVAANATVRVDPTSRVAITAGQGATTHVIIDIVGYYFVFSLFPEMDVT